MTPDADADEEALTLDLVSCELADKAAPMDVAFHPVTAFQLVGLLQLALRHPGVTADLRDTATRFITGVRDYFADCPTVLDVIDRGDDPAQDRTRA